MTLIKQARSLYKDLTATYRLAADAHSFLRLAVDFVLVRIMRFVRVPLMNRERVIHLRDGTRLVYRLNRADLYTIHEVWISEEYRLPVALKPNLIVDLGANIGLASLWLAKQYSCSHVIALEPVAANAEVAKKNFRLNGISAQVMEVAIGAEDGSAVFDLGPSPTNGRVVGVAGGSQPDEDAAKLTVPVMSMATLLDSLPDHTPVGLVKMDIEGGEQDLLCGDLSWLSRVDAMIAELHSTLIDYPWLVERLQANGMERLSRNKTETSDGNTLEYYRKHDTAVCNPT